MNKTQKTYVNFFSRFFIDAIAKQWVIVLYATGSSSKSAFNQYIFAFTSSAMWFHRKVGRVHGSQDAFLFGLLLSKQLLLNMFVNKHA